tara:strand:- start:4420 stop:5226 length:807 start_codon:yes stop_codon:yes gene_type:complete
VNKLYLNIVNEVAQTILNLKKKQRNIFCLISGPQGSGKTTFTLYVKKFLKKKKLKVLVLSIDNFYMSKEKRAKLSKNVSELFNTRGVPGTHDLKLLKEVLNNFKSKKKKIINLPLFSKAHDDILKSKYIKLNFPYDVFILEGWCIGYPGLLFNELNKPINKIEKKFDAKLKWRRYVNIMSKKYNTYIYKKSNLSIFLKIPSFKEVFIWRRKQERQLPKKLRMNDKQLKNFIYFYQRITISLLKNYKKLFDGYISVDKRHNFTKFRLTK